MRTRRAPRSISRRDDFPGDTKPNGRITLTFVAGAERNELIDCWQTDRVVGQGAISETKRFVDVASCLLTTKLQPVG